MAEGQFSFSISISLAIPLFDNTDFRHAPFAIALRWSEIADRDELRTNRTSFRGIAVTRRDAAARSAPLLSPGARRPSGGILTVTGAPFASQSDAAAAGAALLPQQQEIAAVFAPFDLESSATRLMRDFAPEASGGEFCRVLAPLPALFDADGRRVLRDL